MSEYINIKLETEYGALSYEIKEEEAVLNSYNGKDAFIDIPESIIVGESVYAVTGIERKAFLSNKYLVEITIPGSVKLLGDWAFAGCSSLVSVKLSSEVEMGKDVFKDCRSLLRIVTEEDTDKRSIDTGFLLVASDSLLKDRYLFDLGWAGKEDWFEYWDRRMDTILSEHDDEGFVSLVAGGEEDYESALHTLEGYISEKRRAKIRICFLRLLHDYGLSTVRREQLRKYVSNHRAGAQFYIDAYKNGIGYSDNGYSGRTRTVSIEEVIETAKKTGAGFTNLKPQDEAWKVVCEEYTDQAEYYHLLCECGCVCSENIEIMLNDLGDGHARMKALLLGFLEEQNKDRDLFDNMDL